MAMVCGSGAGDPTSALKTIAALERPIVGAGAVAVALTVSGGRPGTLTESAFAPGVPPSVQLVMVATPFASVTGEAPTIDPPPDETVKLTAIPSTGRPLASMTVTAGATATVVAT